MKSRRGTAGAARGHQQKEALGGRKEHVAYGMVRPLLAVYAGQEMRSGIAQFAGRATDGLHYTLL